eukprot:TRINITY_DN6886_c0_g1_i1.p1 TRINITY_DN6886_c0_g1~~TRINITY_DN6886_c0_g1_i1.p1  ORF type:complete len:203 (-),score=64.20 TRINITY_DN6886_c0_g1_i1:138-746(-)
MGSSVSACHNAASVKIIDVIESCSSDPRSPMPNKARTPMKRKAAALDPRSPRIDRTPVRGLRDPRSPTAARTPVLPAVEPEATAAAAPAVLEEIPADTVRLMDSPRGKEVLGAIILMSSPKRSAAAAGTKKRRTDLLAASSPLCRKQLQFAEELCPRSPLRDVSNALDLEDEFSIRSIDEIEVLEDMPSKRSRGASHVSVAL